MEGGMEIVQRKGDNEIEDAGNHGCGNKDDT